ncbi:MAG: hypothetical protein AAF432_01590 [Planctomycetota bacterium]
MSPIEDPRFGAAHRRSLIEATQADAEAREAKSRRTVLILLFGSLAMFPVYAMFAANDTVGMTEILIGLVVLLGIRVVLGVVGCYILAATVVGGMGYLGPAILKLTAIYAAYTVTGIVLSGVPLGWLINFILFVGMVMWIFELEANEAWIFAIVTFLLGWGALLLTFMIFA